jgi:hypothetical protein
MMVDSPWILGMADTVIVEGGIGAGIEAEFQGRAGSGGEIHRGFIARPGCSCPPSVELILDLMGAWTEGMPSPFSALELKMSTGSEVR